MKIKLLYIVILLLIILITGCEKQTETIPHTSSYLPTLPEQFDTNETFISDSMSSLDNGYPDTCEEQAYIETGLQDIINTSEAAYNSGGYALFDNSVIGRYTTGEFLVTYNIDLFQSAYIQDSLINPEYKVIKTEQQLNNLDVVFSKCELFNNYSVMNNQALYCSGEITLSGILRHRKTDEPLFELGQKGDILFYPFPESISDIPLIISGSRSPACEIIDNDNSFYMLSDTVEIYLGNSETKRVYTRAADIPDNGLPETEISYNKALEEYLADAEYYYAVLTFSDLYLLSYQDRMTGEPYSSGIIKEIISIATLDLQNGNQLE